MCREPPLTRGGQPAPPTQNTRAPPIRLGEREGPAPRKERKRDPSTTPSGGNPRLPLAANPRPPHRTRRPRQFASGSARGRPLAEKGNETRPPPQAAGTPAYPRRPTRAPHTEHAGPANSPRGARGAGPSQRKETRPIHHPKRREPPLTPGGQPAPPTQNTPTPPIRLGEREGPAPRKKRKRDPSTTPDGGNPRLPAAANPRLPHRTRRPRQFASGSARGRPLARKEAGPSQEKSDHPHLPHNVRMPPTRPQPRGIASCN